MSAAVPQLSIESFAAGEIDADQFDHEAHLYIAWLYLQELPLLDAISEYSKALQRLTHKLGIPGKYHETITWFYLLLVQQRSSESAESEWFAFRRQNTDLFAHGDDSILYRYYSKELLGSDQARRSFTLPDRLQTPT